MLLSPVIYLKTFYTIIASNDGFFTLLLYINFWSVFGFVILLYIQIYDLVNLIDILMMHDGCKANSDIGDRKEKKDEAEIDSERLAEMYNEIRNCAWEIYKKKRREQWGKSEETTEKECEQLTGNLIELGPDFDALEFMEQHMEWDREKFGDEGVIKIRNVKATEI